MASRSLWAALLLAGAAGCFGGGGITPIRTAFNRGVYLESIGDHQGAIVEYREAVDEDPDDHRARFNLAAAYEARALEVEPSEAELLRRQAQREYEQVLSRYPDHPRAPVNLAALLYDRDPAAGVAMLQQVIARQSSNAAALAALAAHRLYEGAPAEALPLLERAHALDGADAHIGLLLGDAHRALGDADSARATYHAALRREPDEPGLLLALGELEADQGNWREAEAYFDQVLLADPDHFDAHLRIADVYYALGEMEGAAAHLWYARGLQPDQFADPESSRWLIRIYEELLRVERARLAPESADDGR